MQLFLQALQHLSPQQHRNFDEGRVNQPEIEQRAPSPQQHRNVDEGRVNQAEIE